jgi:hypothetical protein
MVGLVEKGVCSCRSCAGMGARKDEMTACVSKNALEASTGTCNVRFDSGEIFIEFVIGLKNVFTRFEKPALCGYDHFAAQYEAMMLIIFFCDGLSEDEYAGVGKEEVTVIYG